MAGANPTMVIRVAANLDELKRNLDEASGGIEVTAKAMENMVARFSGDKVIQQAHAMVGAINDIGGATNLTEKEQAAVNRTLNEAIEKYAVLGQQAPQEMLDLAAATAQVEKTTGGVTTAMVGLGTFLGNMASEAVLALGRLAVEGVGALATGLADLVLKGSDVADVAGNYEHLTAAVGQVGETLLGVLREGTHSTITDFDLMKTVAGNLAAGLQLTNDEYSTLARGAFALAQTGTMDVAEAFAAMNEAMLTGKSTRLGAIIDINALKDADDAYATAHHTVVKELTEGEKIEANREGILRAVGAATERLGEQTDGLDEDLAQVATGWDNFKAKLGLAINESGVLQKGLEALRDAILKAFGGDQQHAIETITKFVNDAAIKVVDFGLILVEWSHTAVSIFGLVKGPVDALTVGINYLVTGFLDGMTKILEAAGHMPLVGDKYTDAANKLRNYADGWREVRDRTVEQMKADDALWKGQGAVHDTLTKTTAVLVDMKAAMVAQTLATKDAAPVVEEFTRQSAAQEGAAIRAAAAQAKFNDELEKFTKHEQDHTKYGVEALGIFGKLDTKLIDTTGVLATAAATTGAFQSGLKFSAETIETDLIPALDAAEAKALSFSDAMALVGQGKGTMTGTVQGGTSLVAVPQSKWSETAAAQGGTVRFDDYGNPYVYTGANAAGYATRLEGKFAPKTGGFGFAGALADGGPVAAGRPYLVGEIGPELFIPASAGSVVPSGAGERSVSITVNTVMGDAYAIARVVKDALAADWRAQGYKG